MKKILSLILTLFCVLSLVGCGRSMDDIIKKESSITGVVEEDYNLAYSCFHLGYGICFFRYHVLD